MVAPAILYFIKTVGKTAFFKQSCLPDRNYINFRSGTTQGSFPTLKRQFEIVEHSSVYRALCAFNELGSLLFFHAEL